MIFSVIMKKQELEQHALILASLSSKPEAQQQQQSLPAASSIITTTTTTTTITPAAAPSMHFSPPLNEDYDEMRVSHMSNSKSDPKKRIRTTPEQLRVLEKTYERETNPSQSLREDIARKLGMTPRRVQVWFQNKRAKERRITKSMNEQPAAGQQLVHTGGGSSDLHSPTERLLMPIIETVPKILTPSNSPQGSPSRTTNAALTMMGSPGGATDSSSTSSSPPPAHFISGGLPLESPPQFHIMSAGNNSPPYLPPPPPQVQSFSVPEGMVGVGGGRRRDSLQGRPVLHLPFPGERNPNPFPGSAGPGSKENSSMRQGDWKLPPLREKL